jgi:2-dehydropantoate 2-reductase
MRILVVGAGALGGYFGGRLVAAGRDVTFLVRPPRAAQLRDAGLVIHSPYGDLKLRDVKTVTSDTLRDTFDLIVLSCKAYDLDDAIASFAPAVGPDTMILPLLNGMAHVDALQQRFGANAVLGGVCLIGATLNDAREIVHLNDIHSIVFGELGGGLSERVNAAADVLGNAGFDLKATPTITQELWEKWVFLASLAGSTCLFRAPIGTILDTPDGQAVIEQIFAECSAIAAANGTPVRDVFVQRARAMLFARGSSMTASMLRDVRNGARTEADHVLGDMIRRGGAAQHAADAPTVLRIAYSQLKAYEAQRGAPAA